MAPRKSDTTRTPAAHSIVTDKDIPDKRSPNTSKAPNSVGIPAKPQEEDDVSVDTSMATFAPRTASPERPRSSETIDEHGAAADGKGKDKQNGVKNGALERENEDREQERTTNLTIEDLQLPRSIITRLAKGVLPPNTQIQANAVIAMSKSAVVFVNHLANAANELTVAQNKKTIMPNDVLRALDDLEFGFMRDRVAAEFAKFNEIQTHKRSSYRKKVAAAKKGFDTGDDMGDDSVMTNGARDMGEDGDHTMGTSFDDESQAGGVGDTTMGSVRNDDAGGASRPNKKARTDRRGDDVDVSDAELPPEEEEQEGEQDEDDEVEEEEEDDENGVRREEDEVGGLVEEREHRDIDDGARLDEDGDESD